MLGHSLYAAADVVAVIEEDVAPEAGVAAGDSGDVEKAFAAQGKRGIFLHRHQSGRERVGKVADIGQPAIVIGRREPGGSHAEGLPEGFDLLKRARVGSESWRRDAGGLFKEVGTGELHAPLLAAGHGMAADKVRVSREKFFGRLDDAALGAADIG